MRVLMMNLAAVLVCSTLVLASKKQATGDAGLWRRLKRLGVKPQPAPFKQDDLAYFHWMN